MSVPNPHPRIRMPFFLWSYRIWATRRKYDYGRREIERERALFPLVQRSWFHLPSSSAPLFHALFHSCSHGDFSFHGSTALSSRFFSSEAHVPLVPSPVLKAEQFTHLLRNIRFWVWWQLTTLRGHLFLAIPRHSSKCAFDFLYRKIFKEDVELQKMTSAAW